MRKATRCLLLLTLAVLLLLLASCGGYGEVGEGEMRIHFFDVGQADATLIRTAKATILVDTGEVDAELTDELVKKLRGQGIEKIDCLVLSHPHSDHIGGAVEVLSEFSVDECLMPNVIGEGVLFSQLLDALSDSDVTVREAYAGRSFTYGDLVLEVLAPLRHEYAEENDYSAVVRVALGECSVLLTGDAGEESELEMLESYGARGLSSTVLKVPHHGAETSLPEDFLEAVDPQYAVISCGIGNSYGHPHAATLRRLKSAGVQILRTDVSGDIVLLYDGKEIVVLE